MAKARVTTGDSASTSVVMVAGRWGATWLKRVIGSPTKSEPMTRQASASRQLGRGSGRCSSTRIASTAPAISDWAKAKCSGCQPAAAASLLIEKTLP